MGSFYCIQGQVGDGKVATSELNEGPVSTMQILAHTCLQRLKEPQKKSGQVEFQAVSRR